MKFNINKQSSLKGLLLLALVANLSWRPAMRSLNLSSETTGPQAAPAAAPAAPSEKAAPEPAKPAPVAAPTTPVPRPDKPISTAPPVETDRSPREESAKICGQRFHITYSEVTAENKTLTEISVEPQVGGIKGFPLNFRSRGGFELTLNSPEVKKDIDDRIKGYVRSKIGRCPEEVQTVTPTAKDPDEIKADKEEKEKLKLAIKECRKNRKGDTLTEIEHVKCQLRRLGEVDHDKDKRGSAARAMAEIERLVKGSIRKAIKNRLMSKDSSLNEEGEELLVDTIDTLKELSRSYRLDHGRMAKLITGLEGLRAGGETYRRSAELQEEIRERRTELATELREAQAELRLNPRDPIAQQRVIQAQQAAMYASREYHTQLQLDVAGGPYAALIASMRLGGISSSEFSEFTNPFRLVQRDIQSLVNPQALLSGNLSGSSLNPSLGVLGNYQSITLPNDFMNYRMGRAGTNPNFQRFGVNQPIHPTNTTIFNQGLYGPAGSNRFGGPR